MNVILQPAGNKGGREHYVDTVANLVPLTTIVPLAPLEIRESINSTYLQGAAAMWGVTAGKKNVNVSKWEENITGGHGVVCTRQVPAICSRSNPQVPQ